MYWSIELTRKIKWEISTFLSLEENDYKYKELAFKIVLIKQYFVIKKYMYIYVQICACVCSIFPNFLKSNS